MNPWCPFATRHPSRVAGVRLTGGPYKGVLHRTESSNYPGIQLYDGGAKAPHFTVDGEEVFQHFPITTGARALRNEAGGVQTNSDSAIQIEWVGFSAHTRDEEVPDSLRRLIRWINDETDIADFAMPFYDEKSGVGILAAEHTRIRMSPAQWDGFNGWCGHQHVPENSHWDPGYIAPGALFTDQEEDDMPSVEELRKAITEPIVAAIHEDIEHRQRIHDSIVNRLGVSAKEADAGKTIADLLADIAGGLPDATA